MLRQRFEWCMRYPLTIAGAEGSAATGQGAASQQEESCSVALVCLRHGSGIAWVWVMHSSGVAQVRFLAVKPPSLALSPS